MHTFDFKMYNYMFLFAILMTKLVDKDNLILVSGFEAFE